MHKNQISILIIDSDTKGLQEIVRILNANSLHTLIETAEDTDDALLKIIESYPDIVMMEYPPKGKTGTRIIKFIQSKLPLTTLAFLCNSKDYAADAIQYEIFNYLIKPIKKIEIERIVEKVSLIKNNNPQYRIQEIIYSKQPDSRLRFHTIKGYIIINPEEILYCKADGAFTEIHLINKSIEITFLFLSKVEEILLPYGFIRISRSIIINRNFIRKVYLKSNTVVLALNGEECEIQGSRLPVRALGKLFLD